MRLERLLLAAAALASALGACRRREDQVWESRCAPAASGPATIAEVASIGAAGDPALASNGEEAALVWFEAVGDGTSELRLVRLDRTGRIVADPETGAVVEGRADRPAAAAGRSGWCVAWSVEAPSGTGRLGWRTFDAAGHAVGAPGVLEAPGTIRPRRPCVAWSGEVWTVVWEEAGDGRAGTGVSAARLAEDGRLLAEAEVVAPASDRPHLGGVAPACAAVRDGVAIAWREELPGSVEIRVARLDAAGRRSGEAAIAAAIDRPGLFGDPWVVAGRSGSTVVFWSAATTAEGPAELRMVEMGSDGVATSRPTRAEGAPGPGPWTLGRFERGRLPGLHATATASGWAVSFDEGRGLDAAPHLLEIDPDAGPARDLVGPRRETTGTAGPPLAPLDGRMLWVRRSGTDLHAAVVDPATWRRVSDVAVPGRRAADLGPAASAGPEGFGVVWRDTRDRDPELYFARIDSAGRKVGEPVRLTRHAGDCAEPALVWNGAEYALAWADERDGNWEIYFRRLGPTGEPVGDEGRITATPGFSTEPALVWDGTGYGIAWIEARTPSDPPDEPRLGVVRFARLDARGERSGDPVPLEPLPRDPPLRGSLAPSLAWNGARYGIAWLRAFEAEERSADLYFAGVDPTGKTTPTSLVARRASRPALVADGAGWALAWVGPGEDGAEPAVRLARFAADGSPVGAGIAIPHPAASHAVVGLAGHDGRFALSWASDVPETAMSAVVVLGREAAAASEVLEFPAAPGVLPDEAIVVSDPQGWLVVRSAWTGGAAAGTRLDAMRLTCRSDPPARR